MNAERIERNPSIAEIEQYLQTLTDKEIENGIRNPSSSGFNTASELGVSCLTFQVLRRLKGEIRPRTSVDVAKIFRLGNLLESPDIDLIRRAQIDIFVDPKDSKDPKKWDTEYFWPKFKIKGHLDAKILIDDPDDRTHRILIPFEHKTSSPNTFRAILKHKTDGIPLSKSRYAWLRKYPAQLMTYMLFMNVPWGLWFFINKSTGQYFYWLLNLDFDYAESLISLAEQANEWVDRAEIPAPVLNDFCATCDFAKTHCFPGEASGPGFQFFDDEDVLAKITRMKEIESIADEYEDLKEEVVGSNAKPGKIYGKNLIVGDFKITSKLIESSRTDVPKEIRDKYGVKRVTNYFRTMIEKIGAEKIEE